MASRTWSIEARIAIEIFLEFISVVQMVCNDITVFFYYDIATVSLVKPSHSVWGVIPRAIATKKLLILNS